MQKKSAVFTTIHPATYATLRGGGFLAHGLLNFCFISEEKFRGSKHVKKYAKAQTTTGTDINLENSKDCEKKTYSRKTMQKHAKVT